MQFALAAPKLSQAEAAQPATVPARLPSWPGSSKKAEVLTVATKVRHVSFFFMDSTRNFRAGFHSRRSKKGEEQQTFKKKTDHKITKIPLVFFCL